jgi:heavy metal sensor kinase
MRVNLRSLRVRLFLLYLGLVLFSMLCLGSFSYWYLSKMLASARQTTMIAREDRIVAYIDSWPRSDGSLSMSEKLRQLSVGINGTDIIQVHELDGTPIYSTSGHDELKFPWPNQSCEQRCFGLERRKGHSIRTLYHVVKMDGHPVRLSLSGTIDEHSDFLETVRNSYLLFCPLLLVVSAAGGYTLSRRALAPVDQMTAQARTIGIEDLTRRLPVPDTGDELQRLAESWNELLQRLESAMARLTQFTADISHDLNTAIAVILSTSGLALIRERSGEEYREALRSIAVECDATSQLLKNLLTIARTDLPPSANAEPVALSALVREVCQQFAGRARVKEQRLKQMVEVETWTRGDASLLRRMISILLDNAIKYTPEGGRITVSLRQRSTGIELVVRDTGVGIAANEIGNIFDRFYRGDPSHCQEDGGNGLGLSIAKWVAEAHGSVISVESVLFQGSTFRVSLPALCSAEMVFLESTEPGALRRAQ